jgi:glutathione synthase/RimK-type ligase-like ATP-grasp enzyme
VIVLWGVATDPVLAPVAAALDARGAPYLLLDQRRALADFELRFGEPAAPHAAGRLAGTPLSEVDAVFLRPHGCASVLRAQGWAAGSPQATDLTALTGAFAAWTELTGALVVNRLSAQASNHSKPGQAVVAARHGFAVPATLVTTDPVAARRFLAAFPAAVSKSVSGVRSTVRRVGVDDLARLADVRHCPTQFQEYVPGVDYRVHVVAGEVFATMVHSDADDYRYATGTQRVPVELPAPLAERCRALVADLRLVLAGVDLRRSLDGRWYCFEVNPSPGFVYFDDGRITAAVARLLCGGCPQV